MEHVTPMPAIAAQQVKSLRDRTGAGFADCKQALVKADGDFDKAVRLLREKGVAAAEKRAGRAATEGLIHSYIHDGRIGVMVELSCETDFVARNQTFRSLANDVAIHIASNYPAPARWVRREDVPAEVLDSERELIRTQIASDPKNSRKPPQVVDRIVTGKLNRFLSERVLLEQPWALDDSKDMTVNDRVMEAAQAIKENIQIRRFVRFERGEELSG